MEKDPNGSVVHNASYSKESESDKSFVGKVKSIISTPLSKWFGKQDDKRPVIRRRDEVFEDEDISEIQPPLKRVKLPRNDGDSKCNNVIFNENCVSATNSVSNHIFNKIPEPVAGPSGLKSHKLLSGTTTVSANSARSAFSSNELLNGHSDSEESTSGYSSVARIGSKEQVCGSQESSKQTSPSQTSPSNSRSLFHKSSARSNRSLFADRSLSPNMNTSLSSRRPNFDASTFGSPNFVDKTISTKRITSSPFYNGKTIYGGASAYGRTLGRSSQDLKTSLRSSVQIKPVNKTTENGNLMLGKTARRILDTIEQYSSPISDAKKIPIVSRKFRQDGLLSKYTGANPYVLRDTKGPPNRELQVPTVSDLMKMKTRLQESTETVRQIATSSKSDLNTEYYKIHTKEDDKDRHTGKMKTKIASARPKPQHNEPVNEVNLAPVSLPITSLPKFDFVIPPPLSTKTASGSPKQPVKVTQQAPAVKSPAAPSPPKTQTETHVQKEKRTDGSMEYKFSDPLVISENIKSIVAINNFKFSEPPVCTKNKLEVPRNATLNFKMPENKMPSFAPSKKASEAPVKPAQTLKTGSFMDVLRKKDNAEKDSLLEKFKPAQGTWECSVCMIRNQPEKTRCVACESPKVTPPKPAEKTNALSSQFKATSDKWECGSCMVYNKNTDAKCVCCTTPKPGPPAENKPAPFAAASSGFGDMFKPSSGTWECGACMIRNKNELAKCAACETPNPKAATAGTQPPSFGKVEPTNGMTKQSDFGGAFKVKSDEWECGTCMVRNKASDVKCQCCETPNPKAASSTPAAGLLSDKKPIATFNFGIDKAAATSFTFGMPPASGASLPKTDGGVTSIFGGNPKPATNPPVSISFGVPTPTPDKPKAAELPTTQPSQPEPPKPTFKFGSAPENPPVTSAISVATSLKNGFGSTTTVSFAAPTTTAVTTSTEVKPFTFAGAAPKDTSEPASKVPMFSFGQSATTVAKTTVVAKKPTFSFGQAAATVAPTTTAAKAPVFSFGQAATTVAPTTAAKTPGFNFGSTSTPAFNFGAAKTETSTFNTTPANNNTFGAPANTGAQNGTFNFGNMTSSNSNQKASFSFGAAGNAAGSGPQAGFNFGGAPASTFAPSTGGFNFSGAASTFNVNAKPTFNFSDGSVTAFSAQPPADGGAAAPRKIKRAVRRTQR